MGEIAVTRAKHATYSLLRLKTGFVCCVVKYSVCCSEEDLRSAVELGRWWTPRTVLSFVADLHDINCVYMYRAASERHIIEGVEELERYLKSVRVTHVM